MTSNTELILRIVGAALVGGAIGLEREVGGHEPGTRTHALVAVGATLFTIAVAYGFADSPNGATGGASCGCASWTR